MKNHEDNGVGRFKLRLAGIRIENYRSFREFPGTPDDRFLEIGDFTTLIGRNDVGKSNFLRSIVSVLEDSKIYSSDFHKSKCNVSRKLRIELKFTLSPGHHLEDLNYGNLKDRLQDECEASLVEKFFRALEKLGSITLAKVCTLGSGERVNCHYELFNRRISRKCLQILREELLPTPIYVGSLQSLDEETSMSKGTLFSELFSPLVEDVSIGRGKNARKLRDILRREIERVVKDVSKDLKEKLRDIWDYVEDVSIIVTDLALSRSVRLSVLIKDKDVGEIPIAQKGMGVQRELLVEFFDIYRKRRIGKGYIFIVEEPEIFLHPGAQRRFMSILKSLSKEGQVMISTHSSIFIDNSDLKHTYLLKRVSGRTVLAVKPQHMDYLSEIGRELGVKPSDALLSNGIIFVEGPSDRDVLEIFARHFYGPEWDLYDVVIMHLGGSNIKNQEFKDLKRVNPNIALVVDADIRSPDEDPCQKRKKKLCSLKQNHGIPVFFWKKNGKYVRELENLFTLDAIKEFVARRLGIDVESVEVPYKKIPRTANVTRIINEIMNRNAQKLGKPANYDYKENKSSDARGIAKIMVRKNQVPKDVKKILNDILQKFQLK